MADVALAPDAVAPLSQSQRLLDTFVAPTATFTDVRRSASWWLPFLVIVLAAYLLTAAIQQKVGWSQLVDNQIRSDAKLQQRIADATPEQAATQHHAIQYSMMGTFYGLPVVDLVAFALMAVILWPTMNFGFAGSATFGRVFCVCVYASLPGAIKAVLGALLLCAGRSAETFTPDTMLGSNVGYYIDSPGALKTLLTSVDLFSIWTAILLSIGLAIVARTKRSSGYIAVFGWWIVITLVRTGFAAIGS